MWALLVENVRDFSRHFLLVENMWVSHVENVRDFPRHFPHMENMWALHVENVTGIFQDISTYRKHTVGIQLGFLYRQRTK